MLNLYSSGDYQWSLFMGHLVIEKLIKALFIKKNDDDATPPRSHDLALLAEKAGLRSTEKEKDTLDLITTFNINARYPDYKQEFYRKCTKEYTASAIEKIQEIRQWLISLLNQQ